MELKIRSYAYHIDIYITKELIERSDEDSRQSMVPLILPTQLESKESDSDCEERSENESRLGVDQNPSVYDEDVGGGKSPKMSTGNKVKPIRVSDCFAKKVCI